MLAREIWQANPTPFRIPNRARYYISSLYILWQLEAKKLQGETVKLSGAQNNVIDNLSKNSKILNDIDSKRFNPLRSACADVYVRELMSRKIVCRRDSQCDIEESLNIIRLTQTVALQHYILLSWSFLDEPFNFASHSPSVH